MKIKTLIRTFLVLSGVFVSSSFAFAQNNIGVTIKDPIKATSVSGVLKEFFTILVQLGAVAVTLMIVYAGFLFVVAQGKPEELNKAKKTLFWTIIGALILLGAQVIASVIQRTVTDIQSAGAESLDVFADGADSATRDNVEIIRGGIIG